MIKNFSLFEFTVLRIEENNSKDTRHLKLIYIYLNLYINLLSK